MHRVNPVLPPPPRPYALLQFLLYMRSDPLTEPVGRGTRTLPDNLDSVEALKDPNEVIAAFSWRVSEIRRRFVPTTFRSIHDTSHFTVAIVALRLFFLPGSYSAVHKRSGTPFKEDSPVQYFSSGHWEGASSSRMVRGEVTSGASPRFLKVGCHWPPHHTNPPSNPPCDKLPVSRDN